MNINSRILRYKKVIKEIDPIEHSGKISQIIGLTLESTGPSVQIGEICYIYNMKKDKYIKAETVGFKNEKVLLMPFGNTSGIGPGSKVVAANRNLEVSVGMSLKGRILDGLGNPIDGLGPLITENKYQIDNTPPNPLTRDRITEPLALGIKSIDSLLTCGRGQRLGIFAGSGVGKSTLLGMMARNAVADVNVIVLVGERGREVKEFIEKDLMVEGLMKSVIVAASSDQTPLVRLKSAMLGTAIAEYFKDQGLDVLLLMDSITRFAIAQREIGMAVGEPPVSRGYTPSVFTTLPRLLERAGNFNNGSITGLYTVLVDGDDLNEPISDAVRGILDGHIVLSRDLANKNHYPPVDVISSISRLMPDLVDDRQMELQGKVKAIMKTYDDAKDLINIGAYKKGTNPEIDNAVKLIGEINKFLIQKVNEKHTYEETVQTLYNIVERSDESEEI